jgi:anaerobic selenocysteine-containing dehydrogenase
MSDVQKIRGACPHDCPDTCATIAEVRDGQAIDFYAASDHPLTQGWLCAKVRPYLERVYHPERLTHPLRRVGPKGGDQWQRVSWDEAIAEIAARWQAIIAEHGAAAILPYSYSGTLGLAQNAACQYRLWGRMGASGLERSICGAAAERAVNATLGARWSPDPRDVLHSRLAIMWGHNPASTSPHFMPWLRQAQKAGCHVVVIDPRRTRTARSADEHIQPRPASDGALALGLMHVLVAEGLHDEAWLRAHTVGWDDLRARLEDYPPERVAAMTDLPEATIIDLAQRYGTTRPAMIKFADGLQRHGNGGQTSRALACLPALVGQYGVRGGGLFYSTSGYIAWDGEALAHLSEWVPTPRTINMNRLGAALTGEAQNPPIHALYVFNANPLTSTPNARLIREGLLRDDLFTVVHELFLTDTARYADIVLPATSQLEHADIHKAYGQLTLQYNAPAIPPLGESKSNWDVMRLLAAALGYTEEWLHHDTGTLLDEVLDATRTRARPAIRAALEGITLERLKEAGSLPLNLTPDFVPFADGHFPTPSGKVELRCDVLASEGLDPLPAYVPPPEFNGGRGADSSGPAPDELYVLSGAPHHFVSSSLANQESLRRREGPPCIELNPADAAARGIANGAQVRVSNGRGDCLLYAVVTEDVPPGVAVAPKGHWAQFSPDGRNINWTTSDALGDLAGQSTFHSNLVRVTLATEAEHETGNERQPA